MLGIQYTNLAERIPLRVAVGLESREDFLSRAVAGYKASQHINKTIPPGKRVPGVETEHVRFYLNPPIDVITETLPDHPLRKVTGSDEDVAAALDRIGYAHLLMSRQAMHIGQTSYANPQFLDRFGTMEYQDDEVALYRMKSVLK